MPSRFLSSYSFYFFFLHSLLRLLLFFCFSGFPAPLLLALPAASWLDSAGEAAMHQSPNGKPPAMYPAHRPPGTVGLTRFGSAPGSLLTTLVDSVVGRGGGGGENGFSAAGDNLIGRFFTGESPCLTSESSCKAGVSPDLDPAGAYGKREAPGGGMGLGLQRSYGMNQVALEDLEMGIGAGAGGLRTAGSSSLIRHSSSPAGFLSHLMVDNGFSRGESYPHSGADILENRRLKSQLSFSSNSLSQISEVSIPDVGESVGGSNSSDEAAGTVGQSFISSNFHLGSWDETNSIVFSAPPAAGKRGKDNSGDIIATLGSMDPSQFGLQKASLEMDKYLQLPQDSVPCKIRAKRGCATHPRSIAERERRTRISEKLRKLQELVPNMDKQTSTSDMLDLAVQYIKSLQGQVQELNQERASCTCAAKHEAS